MLMDLDNPVNYSGLENETTQPTGKTNILAIGVGGAGGNVIRRMIESELGGVNYAVVNTDLQVLNSNPAPLRIAIGKNLTKGSGAGARPEVARLAALEDINDIRSCLAGMDMVFITAGMGGGTGTGAAPVIAEEAKELGILTIAVVTTPFGFEGSKKAMLAQNGIAELKKHIDTLIIVNNDKLLEVVPQLSINKAFGLTDGVLRNAIFGVSNLITGESNINLDFADVTTVLKDKGRAFISIGVGKGEARGEQAAKNAMKSPVLSNNMVQNATGIIIHVEADSDFNLMQVQKAAKMIQSQAAKNADVIFGHKENPQLQSEVQITLIAAGLEESTTISDASRQPFRVDDVMLKRNKPGDIVENADDCLILGEDYEQVIDKPRMPRNFNAKDPNTPAYVRHQIRQDGQKKEED